MPVCDVTFLTSLAKEALPATKAAAADAETDDEDAVALGSPTLTLRTTRGEGFVSCCCGAVSVRTALLLVARARAAARTAAADFGVRFGRLRVGRTGGAAVERAGAAVVGAGLFAADLAGKLSENWYCLLLVEAFAPAEEEAFCLEEQKACRIGQKQELSFQMTASVDSTVRPAAVADGESHVLSTMAP